MPNQFQGSIPEAYDRYLRPLLFEPYARDLAARLEIGPAMRVLEIACGTGIATRALLARLPGDATLVATDFSDAMLAAAQQRVSADQRLAWQPADAAALPFDDASFDAVVCQFGVMFFPDKPAALRQMRRVMRPGGQLLASTWDAIDRNSIARVAHDTLVRTFPAAPPKFFTIPFGFHDAEEFQRLVTRAGFRDARVEHVTLEGHSPSAAAAAAGLVQGSPASVELREAGASVTDAVQAVAQAVSAALGRGELRVSLSALVLSARA